MFTHSPRIVTDGLVLALDAANVKSFRGEPTVNLLDTDLRNWSKDNGSQVTLLTETFRGNPIYRVTFPAGTLPRIRINFSYTTGQTFTGHLFYRYVSGQSSGEAMPQFFFRESGFGTTHTSTSFPITTEFTFRSITHTFSSNGTSMFLLYRSTSSTSTEVVMDFCMPQLEQKPYATPFVNGTRGTTVATGGGWADRSGNGNHGELVNGPTFDSNNGGSLVFDGVDDYVIITNNSTLQPTSSITLESVFQRNGGRTIVNYGANGSGAIKVYCFEQTNNASSFQARITIINLGTVTLIGPILPTETWHHVVMTYNGSVFILYINGIMYTSTNISGNINYPANSNLNIGRKNNNDGEYISGKVSFTRVYNRALTPDEILQNYTATKSRYGL